MGLDIMPGSGQTPAPPGGRVLRLGPCRLEYHE